MVKPRDFLRDVPVIGTSEEVAAEVMRRCGGAVRSVALHAAAGLDDDTEAELLGAMLRSCTAGEEL
jgi:hypothetical protein